MILKTNVYLSDLFTSYLLNAVFSLKHYNWYWWAHKNFSVVLGRLFINKFFPEHSDAIQKLNLVEYYVYIEQLLNNTDIISCKTKYEEAKRRGLEREFGSTTQFWLAYVEMVETTTNNRKLLGRSEIKNPNVMIENIMEALEKTFLSSFHDELDASNLYNIVYGQPVNDSIKENFVSIKEADKQLMSEYIETMSIETHSESTVMDKIKQYQMKKFITSNLSFKVKQNEKTT